MGMLILLIIAIIIAYKVYKILGHENEEEFFGKEKGSNNKESFSSSSAKNIYESSQSEDKAQGQKTAQTEGDLFKGSENLTEKQKLLIKNIHSENKLFTPEKFLQIVEQIYEKLIAAASEKDVSEIEKLCDENFLIRFKDNIAQLEGVKISLIRINNIFIKDIVREKNIYEIEIEIDSLQLMINEEGKEELEVKEVITFSCPEGTGFKKWSIKDIREA